LSSVAIALGPGFIPFAQPIWQRCINIIERTFLLDDVSNIVNIYILLKNIIINNIYIIIYIKGF